MVLGIGVRRAGVAEEGEGITNEGVRRAAAADD